MRGAVKGPGGFRIGPDGAGRLLPLLAASGCEAVRTRGTQEALPGKPAWQTCAVAPVSASGRRGKQRWILVGAVVDWSGRGCTGAKGCDAN